MTKCVVYGLRSSRDGKIRYVGQSTVSPERRLRKHLKNAGDGIKTHLYNWMRGERLAGHEVQMFVIESEAVWGDTERRLIAWYRKHGAQLTNATDGGDGTLGYRWSAEDRKRIAEFMRGRKVPPEVIARREVTAKERGSRKMTPESRAKLAAKLTGRKIPAESIAKRTATRRASGGYVASDVQRKKVSATIKAWWAARKEADHAVA